MGCTAPRCSRDWSSFRSDIFRLPTWCVLEWRLDHLLSPKIPRDFAVSRYYPHYWFQPKGRPLAYQYNHQSFSNVRDHLSLDCTWCNSDCHSPFKQREDCPADWNSGG